MQRHMTFDSSGFRVRGGPAVVEVADSAAIRRRSTDAAPGIELRGVTHRYAGQSGAVYALEPLDLEVEAGSFVAILGPSGCGKTTLLRIVSGLLESTGGQVCLAGESPAVARRRRAIGWLAQEDGLLPWRRVLDNVALPLWLAGEHSTAAAAELLRRVGLDGGGRQYPHELSGGMRQRVALARALVARPPFLLLDEPFAHLDELTRERLGDLLLDLRAEVADVSRLPRSATRSAASPHGQALASPYAVDAPRPPTTLLVTHSVIEAVRLADRVVVLSARPGRIVADVVVDVTRPRREDQSGFGALVRSLKRALGAA
jgi:NitT/TauT family transport system ATP-binding protein